jgi:hypothetical protein
MSQIDVSTNVAEIVQEYIKSSPYDHEILGGMTLFGILNMTRYIIDTCPEEITKSPVAMDLLLKEIATMLLKVFVNNSHVNRRAIRGPSLTAVMTAAHVTNEQMYIILETFPEIFTFEHTQYAISRLLKSYIGWEFWGTLVYVVGTLLRKTNFTHADVIAFITCAANGDGNVHVNYTSFLIVEAIKSPSFKSLPPCTQLAYYDILDFASKVSSQGGEWSNVVNILDILK